MELVEGDDEPGTTSILFRSPAMLLRGMCFRLLDQLPDEALLELYEVMEQLFEFYTVHRPAPTRELVIREFPALRGESYVRPEFSLDEE